MSKNVFLLENYLHQNELSVNIIQSSETQCLQILKQLRNILKFIWNPLIQRRGLYSYLPSSELKINKEFTFCAVDTATAMLYFVHI